MGILPISIRMNPNLDISTENKVLSLLVTSKKCSYQK